MRAWVVSSQRRLSASREVEFETRFEEERVDESRAREDEVREGEEKTTLR
jgi:hypothetical protein